MNIGHAIRSIRKRKSATLEDVAFAANTTASNLSRIELGRHGYSPEMLSNIAAALGVTTTQLYQEADLLEAAPHSVHLKSGQTASTAELLTKDQIELLEAFYGLSTRDQKAVWSLIKQLSKAS